MPNAEDTPVYEVNLEIIGGLKSSAAALRITDENHEPVGSTRLSASSLRTLARDMFKYADALDRPDSYKMSDRGIRTVLIHEPLPVGVTGHYSIPPVWPDYVWASEARVVDSEYGDTETGDAITWQVVQVFDTQKAAEDNAEMLTKFVADATKLHVSTDWAPDTAFRATPYRIVQG